MQLITCIGFILSGSSLNKGKHIFNISISILLEFFLLFVQMLK